MTENETLLDDKEKKVNVVEGNDIEETSLKTTFSKLLIIKLIWLIVCIGLSAYDIFTDIQLSVEYYNGFDHNCLKVYSNLTTVDKSSNDRPAHQGWFYLTLFFIVLPCGVRVLITDIEDLLKNYFCCFNMGIKARRIEPLHQK